VNESEVREYVYEPENDLQEYGYEPQIVDEANADENHEYAYVAEVIPEVIEEQNDRSGPSQSDEKGWSADVADKKSSDSNGPNDRRKVPAGLYSRFQLLRDRAYLLRFL
jgi:hypothetical protein